MTKYLIKGVDAGGQSSEMELQAPNLKEAVKRAHGNGLTPFKVKEVREPPIAAASAGLRRPADRLNRIPREPTPNVLNCHACDKPVATELRACPHCGARRRLTPAEEQTNNTIFEMGCVLPIVIVILLILIGSVTSSSSSTDHRTNQQILDDLHREGRFMGYTNGEEWARDMEALKDAAN